MTEKRQRSFFLNKAQIKEVLSLPDELTSDLMPDYDAYKASGNNLESTRYKNDPLVGEVYKLVSLGNDYIKSEIGKQNFLTTSAVDKIFNDVSNNARDKLLQLKDIGSHPDAEEFKKDAAVVTVRLGLNLRASMEKPIQVQGETRQITPIWREALSKKNLNENKEEQLENFKQQLQKDPEFKNRNIRSIESLSDRAIRGVQIEAVQEHFQNVKNIFITIGKDITEGKGPQLG